MPERLCFECFRNGQPSQDERPAGYHLSTTAEICAGCGQKRVIVIGVASDVEAWRWAKEIEKEDRVREAMTADEERCFIDLYRDTVENITLGYIQEPPGIAIQWKVKCTEFAPECWVVQRIGATFEQFAHLYATHVTSTREMEFRILEWIVLGGTRPAGLPNLPSPKHNPAA